MSRPGPRVSVVIPVRNCRDTIGKCLSALAGLKHTSYEVIVLDDGSTDETPEICESNQWVRTIRLCRGGPSRARNQGISLAAGELVAFTDGDCIVDRQWLNELESGFFSDDVAGVGGDQESTPDETFFGRLVQEFFKCVGFMTGYIKDGTILAETDHNPSCNSMYRKAALAEVGGFDETLFPGEDVDLDHRIRARGYKLVFNPAARVAHYRPATLRRFASMMRRYGESQWPLLRRYGFFRKILFVPPAVIAVTVAAVSLLLWNPHLWPLLLIPLPLAILWFYLKTGSVEKSAVFTMFLTVTLVSWNLGFVSAMLTGRRGVRSPPRKPSISEIRKSLKSRLDYYSAVYRHPRTPKISRALLWIALAYAMSPIDLIPDFIPVIGHLDDVVIVPGLIILALWLIPREVLRECEDSSCVD